MVDLEKVKTFLNIDQDDTYYDGILQDFMLSSTVDILESTGVPSDFEDKLQETKDKENIDSLYEMCQRIYISDIFYERDTTNKALTSFYTKLELAYRRAEKVAV